MYKEKFEMARQRTLNLKLECPEVEYQESRIINQELLDNLPHFIFNEFGRVTPEFIYRNCMGFHHTLQPTLENALGTEIYFTLGNVRVENDLLFHTDEAGIKELMKTKVRGPLNIHAWLTLPTMEILDFALCTTYSIVKNEPELFGAAITRHPDDLTGGMVYEPMILGHDYLRAIGGYIEFLE